MVGAAPRSCEWTRTNNHPVNGWALCQLSYAGIGDRTARRLLSVRAQHHRLAGRLLAADDYQSAHGLNLMPSGAPDGSCGRSAPPQCRTAATAPHRGRRGSYRHGREDKIYSLASSVQFLNIHPYRRGMGSAHATPLVLGLFSEPIGITLPHPRAVCHRGDGAGAVSTNQLVRKEETGSFRAPVPLT